MPWNTGLGAVRDQKMNAGFGGLLIGQNGSRGKKLKTFACGENYNYFTQNNNREDGGHRRKIYCCDFAVKFSTTKQNIIVEQNCFQEVQNFASWLVLEKAYREKNVSHEIKECSS